MLIKVNGEYLDFDEEIEIERQVKLFDDNVSGVDGDFSYQFELQLTSKNKSILGITDINTSPKSLYTGFDCEIETNGQLISFGTLRVESVKDTISCSFFSGNSNWLSEITGDLSELSFPDDFFVEQSEANIVSSWTNQKGITWPLIDRGGLIDRKSYGVIFDFVLSRATSNDNNDFKAFIYVKDVITQIFTEAGIKLKGELIRDATYQKLITTNNDKAFDSTQVELRTAKPGNSTSQGITTTYAKINYTDVTTLGFYTDPFGNYQTTTSKYIADTKMGINVEVYTVLSTSKTIRVRVLKNGADAGSRVVSGNVTTVDFLGSSQTDTAFSLNPGDYLEVSIRIETSGTADVLVGSYVKFTPFKFGNIFPTSLLPPISKLEFISNVFKMFNVIANYNQYTKELTLNLFNKLLEKTPISLTNEIDEVSIDYSEFIGDYAKRNNIIYSQIDAEEIEAYNSQNSISWGSGVIEVNNRHIESESDLFELDFVAPYSYKNNVFNQVLILNEYTEFANGDESDVTSVTDASGTARFNTTRVYAIGDLIRHENFSVDEYNGDGIVVNRSVGNWYELLSIPYAGNSSGQTYGRTRTENTQDSQIIAIFENINVANPMYLNGSYYTNFGIARFHLYNDSYKSNKQIQSLAFTLPQEDENYQVSMIDSYYSSVERILNDPIKVTIQCYIQERTFANLDFLSPVRMEFKDINGLFFINRITGYNGSHMPCEVELIKLS